MGNARWGGEVGDGGSAVRPALAAGAGSSQCAVASSERPRGVNEEVSTKRTNRRPIASLAPTMTSS